ncbi:hypothetical protein Y032_0043g740 [Ancylostoma ceylanicum]|uniref:Uncharacterized protein n=1 Tax=Ancylostoma ceylanicum TaxID=53326 RepID=A0A016UF58_9BILA|nr:hypothetical protein Y032_0043g740 [Ancylostoma ceylanicum]
MAGGDGMLVLGTNALTKLGINLMSATETLPSGIVEKTSNKPDATVRSAKRPRRRKLQAEAATVAKRVYLRPGETKMLSINRKGIPKEGIVWSQCGLVPDMIWDKETCRVELPAPTTWQEPSFSEQGKRLEDLSHWTSLRNSP